MSWWQTLTLHIFMNTFGGIEIFGYLLLFWVLIFTLMIFVYEFSRKPETPVKILVSFLVVTIVFIFALAYTSLNDKATPQMFQTLPSAQQACILEKMQTLHHGLNIRNFILEQQACQQLEAAQIAAKEKKQKKQELKKSLELQQQLAEFAQVYQATGGH